ncbi:MAG: 3D domain-containing protein [bacterium]|nr:3D domain-containing protein [bacterium]
MKKTITALLILFMVSTMGAGTKVSAKSNPVSFSKKYITVNVKKSTNMKSLLKNSKKYTVSWKSSNTKVAYINKKGVLTAKKKGTCVVRAYIKQTKKTLKCTVKVTQPKTTKKLSGKYKTIRVKTVAYCSCRSCSGGYGTNTASGRRAVAGRTIAVDPRVIPLGSKVVIDGHTYVAEDTGVRGKVIDIYMSSHKKTCAYGARYKTVKVYYK